MESLIAAFAWPAAVVVIALALMFLFKAEVRGFLSRVNSVDAKGLHALPAPDAQRENKSGESIQELIVALGKTQLHAEAEVIVKRELAAKGAGLDLESPTSKLLLGFLAAAWIALDFEQIQSLIFGSQVILLRNLNEVRVQGRGGDYVDNYFDEVKQRFGDAFADWTTDQYLRFLLAKALIAIKDGNYHISIKGVEYLVWVAKEGRPDRLL